MKISHILALFLLSSPLWGQSGAQLKMDLEHLERKADEVVSVNLEGKSLEGGSKILALRESVTAPVKELVKGIKGIYMRRFWFGKKEAYEPEDTEPIRKQMTEPGWVRVIDVKQRNKPGAVTVYSYLENEEVAGMAVVSEDEQEITVVNIVGPVDLETLSNLGEKMGFPAMKIATTELPAKQAPPKPAAGSLKANPK